MPFRAPALALAALAAGLLLASASAATGRTLYVSPGGSDSAPCSKSAPCRTFDVALHRAAGGDTIVIGDGTYPGQRLTGSRGPRPVRIVTAPGATPRLTGDLTIYADHVRVTGPLSIAESVEVGHLAGSQMTEDVQVRRVNATSSYIQSVRDVLIAQTDLAGRPGEEIVMIGAYPTSANVVFDGDRIHGNHPIDPSTHLECMFVTAIQGLTVRNTQFRDCGYFDILIGLCCGAVQQPANIVFEHNDFGESRCYAGSGGCPADGGAPFSLMLGTRITGASRIIGNVFRAPPGTSQTPLEGVFASLTAADNTGYAPTAWKARSRITATATRRGRSLHLTGAVTPARPAVVRVTIERTAGSRTTTLPARTVRVSAAGSFATAVPLPVQTGRCRATVALPVSGVSRQIRFGC